MWLHEGLQGEALRLLSLGEPLLPPHTVQVREFDQNYLHTTETILTQLGSRWNTTHFACRASERLILYRAASQIPALGVTVRPGAPDNGSHTP